MKIGKFVPFLLVASLASCGSDLNMGGRGLVQGGEKFNAARVQNVPETTKENLEGTVKGVKINANSHIITNMSMGGQASNSDQWATAKETFDFETKKITMVSTSGSQSAGYTVQIVGDQVKYTFTGGMDEESLDFELNLKGIGDLLETSYKALFSWNFIPSDEDIQKMTASMSEMYEDLGMEVTITGMEQMLTQMNNDYVMSGDYQSGNFEAGFDQAHTYSYTMSVGGLTYSPLMKFSKMRVVFKDYLCKESYVAVKEEMTMVIGEGTEYSMVMKMSIYAETYSTYSYF